MTDVEPKAKTPTKRKSSNAPGEKGPAKKGKLSNAKTPQGGVFPKQQIKNKQKNVQNSPQNIAKKNKKNSESENDSPKKLKPFPGTNAAAKKTGKQSKEVGKKDGTEGSEKRKRKNQFFTLQQKVNSKDKQEAIKLINNKIQAIQSRSELTKTAKKKLKKLINLKKIAEGEPLGNPHQQKAAHTKSESTKRRERKKNAKNQGADTTLQKKESEKVVPQSSEVKVNGKSNKNVNLQNKGIKKAVPQKLINDEEESDDEDEDESDEDGQELEDDENESADEEELGGEEESGEEEESGNESDEEGEEEEEEESDEDDSEEDSPPPPKVSNKKQKKK